MHCWGRRACFLHLPFPRALNYTFDLYLFILILAALGLHGSTWTFSSCGALAWLPHGLLPHGRSLVPHPRDQTHIHYFRKWVLDHQGGPLPHIYYNLLVIFLFLWFSELSFLTFPNLHHWTWPGVSIYCLHFTRGQLLASISHQNKPQKRVIVPPPNECLLPGGYLHNGQI